MLTKKDTIQMADNVAAATEDAYSFDRYTKAAWPQVARRLARAGYTERQIEAVLRSKWMRWAGDHASKNDHVTSADFLRYVEASYGALTSARVRTEILELERETFNE